MGDKTIHVKATWSVKAQKFLQVIATQIALDDFKTERSSAAVKLLDFVSFRSSSCATRLSTAWWATITTCCKIH